MQLGPIFGWSGLIWMTVCITWMISGRKWVEDRPWGKFHTRTRTLKDGETTTPTYWSRGQRSAKIVYPKLPSNLFWIGFVAFLLAFFMP